MLAQAWAYQRPRVKKPSSSSTSTMIRMIQRIDTDDPFRWFAVPAETPTGRSGLRRRLNPRLTRRNGG
jgi:hypothetical protein